MKLLNKPQNVLLFSILLFFAAGFLYGEPSFDFHVRDTYYVATSAYFNWLPVIFLGFIWLLYTATHRFLYSQRLVWIHILINVLALFVLSLLSFISWQYAGLAGAPRRYYDYDTWKSMQYVGSLFQSFGTLVKIKLLLLLIIFLSQVIYIINLTLGIVRKHKRKRLFH